MVRVEIVPVPADSGGVTFHAIAGERQSVGSTAGEALDALTAQLPEDEVGTLVVVQRFRPDRSFGAEQQTRLSELMERWRAARDAGTVLPAAEQAALDRLIQEELEASIRRTGTALDDSAS